MKKGLSALAGNFFSRAGFKPKSIRTHGSSFMQDGKLTIHAYASQGVG
jgi:hypothetical protein